MPRRALPRIAAVSPGPAPMSVVIYWRNGKKSRVDLAGLAKALRAFEPLRDSPELFCEVHVGERGACIVWFDGVDMSAAVLWRLAQEQAGAAMTADAFKQWRKRKAYTIEAAARALGVSCRAVAGYEHGVKAVPRDIALAARTLET